MLNKLLSDSYEVITDERQGVYLLWLLRLESKVDAFSLMDSKVGGSRGPMKIGK